jgi:hypothetical protein
MRRAAAGVIAAVLVLCGATCRGGRPTSLEVTVENGADRRSYTLYCDPAGGSHPDAVAACLTLEQHGDVMLADLYPGRTCIGGVSTVHIQVEGKYRNERVRGRPDACSGNPDGERLWMKDLPPLERR